MTKTINNQNRRDFMRTTAVAGIGASLLTPNFIFGQDDRKVNIGFIGVGHRGRKHLQTCLNRKDVDVKAICDIDPEANEKATNMLQKYGYKNVPVYDENEYAFKQLLERDDIQGVVIATPWLWHTKMAVVAMKAGKYVGVEVSAANTVEECWDLVNTHESTGVECMILENACYNRERMAILSMVRDGLFGEVVHLECGYKHDLRGGKFSPGVSFGPGSEREARWRTYHSINRNGDLYPTHGIGPVATFVDIDHGNRFVSLTSTASKSRGLHDYIVKKAGEDHPNADINFKLGDVVTSVIKTVKGETIVVTHDTNLPRPKSAGMMVQGTNGIWMDLDQRIYLDEKSPDHEWEPLAKYMDNYDHPLWEKYGEIAAKTGHGGNDFFIMNAFVGAVKDKAPAPLDVYDAAAWSAITPLSEQSIANGSEPVAFPDFTRGDWMKRKPSFGFSEEY